MDGKLERRVERLKRNEEQANIEPKSSQNPAKIGRQSALGARSALKCAKARRRSPSKSGFGAPPGAQEAVTGGPGRFWRVRKNLLLRPPLWKMGPKSRKKAFGRQLRSEDAFEAVFGAIFRESCFEVRS